MVRLVMEGEKKEIWAISDRSDTFEEFFYDLEQESDKKKITRLCQRFVEHGPPHNIQKFRKLAGRVWELKPTAQIRLLGGWDVRKDRRFIISHAIRKKSRRPPQREIEKAERRLRQEMGE